MDYFKVPYTAYVILIICVVIISFLKLLLSNKLILHTLHKKNYGGNFSIIKASLISLLTEVLKNCSVDRLPDILARQYQVVQTVGYPNLRHIRAKTFAIF